MHLLLENGSYRLWKYPIDYLGSNLKSLVLSSN